MDSSVSPKDEILFLRVCHHISNAVYLSWTQSHSALAHYSKCLMFSVCVVAEPSVAPTSSNHPQSLLRAVQPFLPYRIAGLTNSNWDCAYAESFEDLPTWTNWGPLLKRQYAFMGGRGHNFGWKAFWDSNPDWSWLSSDLGKAAMPEESAGRIPTLLVIPWHSSYNCGINHGKYPSLECRNVSSGQDSAISIWSPFDRQSRHVCRPQSPYGRVVDLCQPMVRVGICRAAELRDWPHQVTFEFPPVTSL